MSEELKTIEYERKFRVSIPTKEDIFTLKWKTKVKEWSVSQTYLKSEDMTERCAREIWLMQKPLYGYTEKIPVSSDTKVARVVKTRKDLTKEEYEALLAEADPKLQTLTKQRYSFRFGGNEFYLDVYPFSKKEAILEVRLPHEESGFYFPPYLQMIAEVTTEPAYRNRELAKNLKFPAIV